MVVGVVASCSALHKQWRGKAGRQQQQQWVGERPGTACR